MVGVVVTLDGLRVPSWVVALSFTGAVSSLSMVAVLV